MPLQYIKKELSDEVDFLHADKHESLLQVDSIIIDGFGQVCPWYQGKFVNVVSLYEILRKKSGIVFGT